MKSVTVDLIDMKKKILIISLIMMISKLEWKLCKFSVYQLLLELMIEGGTVWRENIPKFKFGANQSGIVILSFRFWWPYQETAAQPESGRFRKVHVIETEVQKDEHDDEGKRNKIIII